MHIESLAYTRHQLLFCIGANADDIFLLQLINVKEAMDTNTIIVIIKHSVTLSHVTWSYKNLLSLLKSEAYIKLLQIN
jgi:hypothetical protein